MRGFYFRIRWGNWMLCGLSLYRFREHTSVSGKVRWHDWDKVF